MASGGVAQWSIAACLVLGSAAPGCSDQSSGAGAEAAGGQSSTGQMAAAGQGAAGQGAAGQGAAGQGALGEPPLVDISGRWGMFLFEDPVAVNIVQRGNALTGLGCDAGLPDPALGDAQWCAPLTGEIEADRARFGFDIPGYSFRAEVTVSHDASRMAGEFTDVTGRRFNSSWLRLRDDQRGLAGRYSESPAVPVGGRYELRLIETLSPGTSFDPLHTYAVTYAPGWGIYGDLGAFYYTELSGESASAGPILVGPVPATDPAFPVSIRFDHGASVFTHAAVVDVRGVVSEFDVTSALF